MLHTVLVVAGLLVVAAVVVAFVVMLVGDLRRTGGEPPSPDTQRNLDAQRRAEQRTNRSAGWSGLG